jgi:hypothetical protein
MRIFHILKLLGQLLSPQMGEVTPECGDADTWTCGLMVAAGLAGATMLLLVGGSVIVASYVA